MMVIRALFVFAALFTLCANSQAQALFGSTAAGATGELYVLNPTTGVVLQTIGPLNDLTATNYPITGLAFHPITGTLYGSTGNSTASTAALFVSINPATALVTIIGPFNAGPVSGTGTPATMADIAFDAAGNLFGIGSIGGPQLYSINLATGQATVIGGTGLTSTTGGGLAISPSDVFFGTPTAARYGTYDEVAGTFTNIANPVKPVGGGYGALDFDATGTLFGLNVGAGSPPPTHLVTFNLATGAITDLGVSVSSLDAIAFQVPEPGVSAWLLAVGALAACGRRRLGRQVS